MMPFEFGEIVLVRFPFTNQVGSKQRPGVIVSSRDYNMSKPDLILMAVTSQLRKTESFGEVWIEDWKAANLLKPSAIKPLLATFEHGLVLKSLGKLQPADLEKLMRVIDLILG